MEMDSPFYYIFVVGLMIFVFLYMRNSLEDSIIIIASVAFGALMATRGLGVFTGSFPDELYLITLIRRHEMGQAKREVVASFYANFVILCAFIIAGFAAQYLSLVKDDKKDSKEGTVETEKKDEKQNVQAEVKDN